MDAFEAKLQQVLSGLMESVPAVYTSKPIEEMSAEEKAGAAARIREMNLWGYQKFLDAYQGMEDLRHEIEAARYCLKAYEQMTTDEILATTQRETFVRHVRTKNLLIDLEIAQLDATRPKLNPPRASRTAKSKVA